MAVTREQALHWQRNLGLADDGKPAPKASKYHNVRVHDPELGDFDSKKEHRYCQGLELRKRAGDISYYLRQVPYRLPGGVVYRADFVVYTRHDVSDWDSLVPVWEVEVIDVKGLRTKTYALKKKQVEALYPVQIVEV